MKRLCWMRPRDLKGSISRECVYNRHAACTLAACNCIHHRDAWLRRQFEGAAETISENSEISEPRGAGESYSGLA